MLVGWGGAHATTFAFNVAPSSPNCSSQAGGGVACSEQIDAPVGNDGFTVTTYDTPLGADATPQGHQLSTGTTYQTVTEGTQNTIGITLDGTPASVSIALANPSLPQGSQSTTDVTMVARDAAGYTIVGGYSTPIQFPCTQIYSLSTTVNGQGGDWIWSSSDSVSLSYFGSGITMPTTLQACLPGANTVILGSVQFSPQATFGTELPVDTSLDGSTFVLGNPTSFFTEPAKSRLASLIQNATQPLYYPVPSGAQPLRMLVNGGIFFSESNGEIGDMTNNSIIERQLPTANAGLYALGGIWSYDFSIWFTEHNAGKVGEVLDGSQQIVEYATGFPNSAPAGMANAGTGFFYADPGANAIGFVNPSHGGPPAFAEYSLPTPGANPLEITSLDANQRAWFTEHDVSKVGRIDLNGNIDEFPSADVPVAIQLVHNVVFVLTASHTIERYDINTGAATTITPPSSVNGPVVAIADGGLALELLRGNGVTGALQTYSF